MFGSRKTFCIAAATAMLLGAGAAQAEKVKNPEYESWAKCKAGAMVKIEGGTETMGTKTKQNITTKLIEITPEKAVIEQTVSIEAMGQKMDQPPMKREVPATIDNAAPAPADPNTPAPKKPDVKEGEETVTVAGKSLKCKTTEMTTEQNGMKAHSKTWSSPEVPGTLVKSEIKTTGSMESTTTMQLVEFSTGK